MSEPDSITIPIETSTLKITWKHGEKHRGFLATIINQDPDSPLAAIMIDVRNADGKKQITPDSVGFVDIYYVPREQKRGNFTGKPELDSFFVGASRDGRSFSRGLDIGFKADHSDFIKKETSVVHPDIADYVDIAAHDPEKNMELYKALKDNHIISTDADQQVQQVFKLVRDNALYMGERKWTERPVGASSASSIIMS